MASNQLELDLEATLLQRLAEAPVGAARDALFQQRKDAALLVRDSIRKMKDEVRCKTEIIERSESNLVELRLAALVFFKESTGPGPKFKIWNLQTRTSPSPT